jgi:hypothetical protein
VGQHEAVRQEVAELGPRPPVDDELRRQMEGTRKGSRRRDLAGRRRLRVTPAPRAPTGTF